MLAALVFLGFALPFQSLADTHTTGVPVLNSRPGATYTIYLDVAGFNYNGVWSSGELMAPGSTPSLNLNGEGANVATFSATDQSDIKAIWERLAQSYIGFNVNVTTVDPAVAAGQAGTDAARQAYYDSQPDLMHTVVGSQVRDGGKWYSNAADGVSGLGVVSKVGGDAGSGGGGDSPPDVSHTNWMFTEGVAAGGGDYIGAIASHENGHAFGLHHQSDYTGNTLVNEYSNGDAPANTGNGSFVATMGNASGTQRVAWRSGDSNTGDADPSVHTQNDVGTMLSSNSALHLVNDGVGKSMVAATPLALNGGNVDFNLATGVIVPISEANPDPVGAANYTSDWFSFTLTSASTISLTATDGTDFLIPGVADGVGTLRSTLAIYGANGVLIGSALEDPSTLFETYSGLLGAGTYYADVASSGGAVQNASSFNAATYYNMGAFFLTGSGFSAASVPEPGSVALIGAGLLALLGCRRRR